MDKVQACALLFSGALLFLAIAWWNHKSGVAVFNVALQASRHSYPRRFWIIQGLWILLSAILAVCGFLVCLGVLAPN